MPHRDFETLVERGIARMGRGDFLSALVCLEKAAQGEVTPRVASHLALCLARERGQVQKGVALCRDAISREPDTTVHYLNLGRIHLLRGDKEEALSSFRAGLAHGHDPAIVAELERLGNRKPPPIPFLKRSNPVNRYLGILLNRLGLR